MIKRLPNNVLGSIIAVIMTAAAIPIAGASEETVDVPPSLQPESINALVEERCAKVDHWKNSSHRHRWLATALVDIEPRLRKVVGYRHLPKLREALRRELNLEKKTSDTSKKKVA